MVDLRIIFELCHFEVITASFVVTFLKIYVIISLLILACFIFLRPGLWHKAKKVTLCAGQTEARVS